MLYQGQEESDQGYEKLIRIPFAEYSEAEPFQDNGNYSLPNGQALGARAESK